MCACRVVRTDEETDDAEAGGAKMIGDVIAGLIASFIPVRVLLDMVFIVVLAILAVVFFA